ncbi:MAG TPA: phenylalanine--tRNA ligase subunit alpha [Candidatus Pacearchaeota archaeon]|nr:phenylalanine--tRNA ligase subunit alpha [Candidatus Pacearchaeota archaeon]
MDKTKLIESLSPNEKRILPHLGEKLNEICKKSNLDKTSVIRALEYLQNKNIVKITYTKTRIIELDINGALYLKKGLPERRLLHLLTEKHIVSLNEAQQESKLSDDEFKASLGALKKKALIELKNGKIILNANKSEITKKTLEEQFLEILPTDYETLAPEHQLALKNLQARKQIVEVKEEKKIGIEITQLGKEIIKSKLSSQDLIEKITPEILKKESSWKGKKFRRYDITSPVPEINGGKRHFVNQSTDYARKIWTEMGFKEMTGDFVQSSFWNFDALFTAQDHPVREMHDTFFINKKGELPEKKIVSKIKESHEKGISGSKGWQYTWNEEEAKRLVLRTHTTCLSAQILSKLKKEELPAKFFAVGKCFRNETLDWNHGFEFNQTEGIVIDENANLRNLLGYLTQFAKKMGFEKVKFIPSYFPYTEPSVEGYVWNEDKKKWIEVFAAGIFRPEVTEPLLGKPIPVLAWGPGFDRIIMNMFDIKDIRDLYKNNLTQLRKMKFWTKQ